MLTARSGAAIGLVGLSTLLGALAWTVGLSGTGLTVGLVCGVAANGAVVRGLAKDSAVGPGPADWVTLTRATLVCGVAALVADSPFQQPAEPTLLSLAVVALVLDGVDGWVARHTGTASMFGARFDGEVDAFLLLVLSLYVASSVGAWVIAIGAARYAFLVAGWLLPWLRAQLPRRYWRKVVAATQGIVLTTTAADILPRWLTYALLAIALGLLAESFGRDVWWLRRNRRAGFSERAEPVQAGTGFRMAQR